MLQHDYDLQRGRLLAIAGGYKSGATRPERVTRAAELEFRKGDSENAALEALFARHWGTLSMKIIRSYSMQFEADLARIALEGADIPAVVVGVGMGMEGGIGGVQLLVPEDRIEAAQKVLKEFEDQDEHLE